MTKKVLFPLVAAALLAVTGCSPKTFTTSSVSSASSSEAASSQAATSEAASEASSEASSEVASSSSEVSSKSYYDDINDTSKKVDIKMAVLYQDTKANMAYGEESGYKTYTDPAGNTYQTGDLKPAWKALSNRLNIGISDVHTGKDVSASYATEKGLASGAFTNAQVLNGKASSITADGTKGDYFINFLDYLDYMPNFDKFLTANPIVKLSITSNAYTTDGSTKSAIYYAPYFDGYDDVERMTLLRVDWVSKLLDDTNPSYDTDTTITSHYNAVGTDAGRSVSVAADLEGKTTKTITRKAGVKNIITQMNELTTKNGETLTKCLKAYISEAYGTQYSKLSDFYCGVDSAYDADEFIALLRCVKANPQLLAGTKNVTPFYPRANTNDRVSDIYRWAGQLFGLRGLESRSNYLYSDKDGTLHDARGDASTAHMLTLLNQIYSEGLILENFDNVSASTGGKGAFNDDLLAKGTAFATYDYNQTQTAYNNKVTKEGTLASFDFEPILGAVADLDDGVSGNYTHFTESWRSVKSEGWCLSKVAIGSDNDTLMRCLKLVDYFYSDEGNMLMSYGPEEYGYIQKDASGNIQYIDYNGKKVPQLSDAMLAQFRNTTVNGVENNCEATKATAWNYTNYYRYWVGSTYPVGYVKEQGMEYQCTAEEGKAGQEKINANIVAGTYEHPLVDNISRTGSNPFYDLMPTTFRLTSEQVSATDELANLKKITSEKITGGINEWDKYVIAGFGGTYSDETLLASEAAYVETVGTTWGANTFGTTYNNAYQFMLANY